MPTPTIATRTEPIGIPSLSDFCLTAVRRAVHFWPLTSGGWTTAARPRSGWPLAGGAGVVLAAALGVDEVREPPHLALDRLDAVALELHGVAVDLLLGHRQLALDPLEALLETGAPALEDAQPDLHVGAAEEREPDVEVVVLPRRGTDLHHQALELALSGLRELVDDARAPGDRGDRGGGLLDQGAAEHLLQRGVERPVREHPTPSEHEVEPLAELVAVHGSLVQQSEDCELDGLCATCHATYRSDISARCESWTCSTSPWRRPSPVPVWRSPVPEWRLGRVAALPVP